MDRKERETEEGREVRHKITAEETFTLAKDVFDIRCFVKNVYANRALIARRLNLFSLVAGLLFTLLYTAYAVVKAVMSKLSLGWEIALFSIAGLYVALVIALLAVTAASGVTTKTVKKYNKTLKIFRYCVKVTSLAMAVAALVLTSVAGGESAWSVAVDIVFIVLSVVVLIIQTVPLVFGGLGGMVRWLLSPAKIKLSFSDVSLEWYRLVVTGSGQTDSVKKVAQKYIDDAGRCIDTYLIPAFGKKRIAAVNINMIYAALGRAAEEDVPVLEGTVKSVFRYAEECGYITLNPCKDMELEGSIDEEERKKKTMKDRLLGVGQKIGKSVLDKYLNGTPKKDD